MTESDAEMAENNDDLMADLENEAQSPGIMRRLIPWLALARVHTWWLTRRWWRFLEGVPAILVAGLILLPAGLSGFVNPLRLTNRYRAEVNEAVSMNDHETADLYLRKLLQLGAMDPGIRYAIAFVAERQGDRERAKTILTELASVENGDPRAHLWMAKQLAAGKSEWTVAERKALIHHLQAALRIDPPPNEAHIMLGKLFLQTNDFDQAIAHFEAAIPQRPDLHLSLGQIYLQLGDPQRAKRELQQAADFFQKRVDSKADDVDGRVAWALACRLQNDFSRAKEILFAGLKTDPNNPMLRSFLASFCIDEFDALVPADDQNLDQRLGLLESAIAFAPNDPAVLDRLATFCSVDGDVGDRARSKLKEILATGKATATIHLILAIQAITKGDSQKAELHFEQGFKLNPRLPVLLNNFAWLLAHQEKPQLDRALTLVNEAIEIMPNEPQIRETRGQIFVKLKRWREALTDLEIALPKMSGNRGLHASLGRVYRELGEVEIAEKHERIAQGK